MYERVVLGVGKGSEIVTSTNLKVLYCKYLQCHT